ncbi:hypothetical protein DP113_34690 (plasmid) [Brasilonema octagenarum UFV-E1]|uniref:Uncharacterized protein n=2 Tax=Brasilonema TaxID=383614 RepID=A0A856MN60_9CYAN|nr:MULTISPECIES: hypothetical protein [Brasilonema]NMF66920.1 hypothetical protein [Brasilonema octagenarum UFV-OR1]QDL12853.1 hypothetical protein DP114_34585 [Brasilonema sennae CENA114]QDL19249.1 hypothetical protein DP113_34690 [Brasilonema octagenarum UFV-E1]
METNKTIIDISEKFGSWTVLGKQGKQVLCQCDCGTQKLVYSHTLTNGRSTNCGCNKRKESIPPGATFGRLTVISDVEAKGKRGELLLLTQCSCGTQKYISKNSLKRGLTQSCGCLRRENIKTIKTVHSRCKSHEYNSWLHIKRICYNKNHHQYKYHGGCGIEVDASWRNNFTQFLKDMGLAPNGTVISRISPEGDFAPGNCQWISKNERYHQIHLLRKKEIFIDQTFPEPVVKTREINIPQNIIQAIIKAHAAGEANINKLAAQYKISTQDTMNIILSYIETI